MGEPNLAMRTLSRIAPLHRAIFVLSTAGVAVSASTVAEKTGRMSGWTLVVGFGLLLFVADLLRAMEDRAIDLSRTSMVPLRRARADVLASEGLTLPVGLLLVALGLIVGVAVAAAL